MHDEVTCEQCRKSCEFIYGAAVDAQLADYMSRHHGTFGDCSKATLAKLQQFAARLREEFPDKAIGVDFGEPGTDHAVTSTTCARCSHTFTSRPDGFVDEALENEIAAHQELCVIVGDYVRITMPGDRHGGFFEGELLDISRNACGACDGYMSVSRASPERMKYAGTSRTMSWGAGNTIRRIPRQQQGDRVRAKQAEYANANPHQVAIPQDDIPLAPAPVLYDGLTAEQCLERYEMRQREGRDPDDSWGCARITLTPVQLAAARDLWSLYLKAKIAASATAERNRVRVELQCDEDPTW